MRAKARTAKVRDGAVAAGLCAIGVVLASVPAFAAGGHDPGDAAAALASTAPCTGAVPPYSAAGGPTADSSRAPAARPLIVWFAHRLGKREALRRVKSGLDGIVRTYSGLLFSVQEETWTDYHLNFRVSVIGLPASGSIDVADRRVCLEAFLPWLLAPLADAALPAIRKTGVAILEGK